MIVLKNCMFQLESILFVLPMHHKEFDIETKKYSDKPALQFLFTNGKEPIYTFSTEESRDAFFSELATAMKKEEK